MSQSLSRRIARAASVALLGTLLLFAGTLGWRAERSAAAVAASGANAPARPAPRLHYQPALTAGAGALWQVGADPALARDNFRHVLDTRPLYGPAWLHLADLEARLGNGAAALDYADRARELWPSRRILLWDIARFYIEQNAMQRAFETYVSLLRVNPGSAQSVLNLLLKRGVPRASIAEKLLAAWPGHEVETYQMFTRLFREALRARDPAMLRALWLALDAERRGEDPYAAYMIGTGYQEGRPEWVCEAWIARVGGRPCFNTLVNGDFESRELDSDRGWQLREYAGYSAEVDRDGRLQIRFSGTHNVNLRTPQQRVPLRGSGSLALVGRWRGEQITTRSGVFLQVIVMCADARHSFSTDDRYKSWDWQAFRLVFDYDERCHTATVRVRRGSTNALDNKIGGTVWLDDLRLEPQA